MLEGLVGRVLPSAGHRLRAGDPGVAVCRADDHAGVVAADAAGTGSTPRSRALVTRLKGWYRAHAAAHRRSARCVAGGVLAGLMVATLASVPFLGEEFLPEFSRVRLPDALGRKAGHLDRGDAPHHRAREQGAAGDSGRAELRLAHRPRRSRRRSRRPELHRALDQPRSRASTTRPRSRKSRRWSTAIPGLYRDLLTYLRERIKEVLDRRQRDHRRAHRGAGPGSAAGACRRGARRPGADRRRGRSQGAAAGAGAADRGQVPARSRRAARPHRRRRAPRRDHGGARIEGRRVLRGPALLRRRGVGHAGGARQHRSGARDSLAGAGRQHRAAERGGRRRDRAGAERDHARERRAPHRRDVQRVGPRPRLGGARHRCPARDARSRRRLSRRSAGRVRRARGVEPIAADVGRRGRWSASS